MSLATNPKVLSLGFVHPEHSVTQDEALDAFGYTHSRTKKIFESAGIDKRYSWVNPERFKSNPDWQELCDEYHKGALELGVNAAYDAHDGHQLSNIGCIVFSSVSGYTCPSMSYEIARELNLDSDIVHTNILGQGCQASAPSLERAYDYVRVHPQKKALALSVEICSATWFPAIETDLEYIVSSAIFADGASAAIVGYDDKNRFPECPEILDFESYFHPDLINLLGYKWEQGRLKVVLDRSVPKVVPQALRTSVNLLLERNGLNYGQISHWMIHPGGRAVLENIESELGLSREQTHWSWGVMRQYGNMSSATLGAISKFTQQHDNPSGYGVACTMGAGGAVNSVLVKWK
jgi:predicted naringenin-chalcone synthase